MRRLILMRHGEAEPSSAAGDRGRVLTARGRADASLVGRALADKGFVPGLALVSPAARTRETWDVVSAAFGDAELVIEAALYDARADALMAAVRDVADRAGVVMLVGHNPGLHQLVFDLAAEGDRSPPGLDLLARGLAPADAAVFAIDPDGRVTLEAFLTPDGAQ